MVAARHRKITNQRKDFHHKRARALVERYDLLVVDDLQNAKCCGGPSRACPSRAGRVRRSRRRTANRLAFLDTYWWGVASAARIV
ncbi:hypothetical protein [Mycobacterium sp.]|jgi:transposase|uniref:hypothetical protein n=1 Tax=Mycobacterium sp. TaxID=1785 RepID=UPI0039C97BB2